MPYRNPRVICTRAEHQRDSSVYDLPCPSVERITLLVIENCRLARCSTDYECPDTCPNLPLDQILQCSKIYFITRKGGYQRRADISFDVNYRATLWSEEEAKATIERVLPLINILFISEETLRRMFGMTGDLKDVHRDFAKKYPSLKVIASTKRTVISPQKHSFTSLIYDVGEDRHFTEPEYGNIDVVDRIGSGDAYVAGALYGLLRFGRIDEAAKYGNAMAALKNTVNGDMTVCDLRDIERIIASHNSTGPKNEMIR